MSGSNALQWHSSADRAIAHFMVPCGCQWLYHYFKLETDTKIKKMDNLDDLSRCFGLKLLNEEAIEDEEVVIMEAILAKMARDPRPPSQMPRTIIIPKVNS